MAEPKEKKGTETTEGTETTSQRPPNAPVTPPSASETIIAGDAEANKKVKALEMDLGAKQVALDQAMAERDATASELAKLQTQVRDAVRRPTGALNQMGEDFLDFLGL